MRDGAIAPRYGCFPYPLRRRIDGLLVVRGALCAGTYDNDTTLGWFTSLAAEREHRVREYLRLRNGGIADALTSAALQSMSLFAMVPMQGLVKLDSSHFMNTLATTRATGAGSSIGRRFPTRLPADSVAC